VNGLDKYQIAKELTLAIVDKIKPTNLTNQKTANQSYIEEVCKAYISFFNTLKQIEKDNYIGPVKIND
jgi:hypothetical protein